MQKEFLVTARTKDNPNEFNLGGYLRTAYLFNTSLINNLQISFDGTNYITLPYFKEMRIFAEDTSKNKTNKIQTQYIRCFAEGTENIILQVLYTIYAEDENV